MSPRRHAMKFIAPARPIPPHFGTFRQGQQTCGRAGFRQPPRQVVGGGGLRKEVNGPAHGPGLQGTGKRGSVRFVREQGDRFVHG